MYSRYLHNNKTLFAARLFGLALILGLLFAGPAFFAFSEEQEPPQEEEVQQQTQQEPPADDSDNTEGNSGNDGDADGGATVVTGDAVSGEDTTNEVNTNNIDTDTTGEDEDGNTEENTEEEPLEEGNTEGGDTDIETSTTTDEQLDTEPLNEEGDEENEIASSTEELLEGNSCTEGQIDVNSASKEELTGIHGVGPVIAQGIIDGRPFASLDELLDVSGIGESVLADIKEEGLACIASALDESQSLSVDVENENEGTLDNTSTSTAETGENTASGGGGTSTVLSGNSLAYTNLVNVVNTNIIDSFGFLILLNTLFGTDSLDLSWLDFSGAGAVSSFGGCTLVSCDGGDVAYHASNTNTAMITNTVVVRSSTGGNTATSTGDALVATGNAYASANVINVANTNIVNSNYLLLSLNNFGDFAGDIVLPGKSFFEKFFGGGFGAQNTGSLQAGGSHTTDVENENDATIENNVDVGAETGENSATSTEGAATVATGDAVSGSSVVNQVNTNLFGDKDFYILLRVHGNFSGNIFSVPQGISWAETASGIQIFSDGSGTSGTNLSELSVGANTTPASNSTTSVKNANTASILNNIQVLALTGDNRVESEEGDATVLSGNAYASANVVNVANTNVVGRNWVLAIFNIFGNFSGDIAFGRPDLWVGGAVEASNNPLLKGERFTYKFTVSNFGDADATGVTLQNIFDNSLLSFDGSDFSGGGTVGWNLGTIEAGETVEVVYEAKVSDDIPSGNSEITTETTVTSNETDNNTSDNTEFLSLLAHNSTQPPVDGKNITYTPESDLSVKKTSSATTTIRAGDEVDYEITVVNNGGSAYSAELVDTITDDKGNVINKETWNLGEIFPDEEIVVTYTVVFNGSTTPGVYINSAEIFAIDKHPSTNPFYGGLANAGPSKTSLMVIAPSFEEEEEEEEEVIVEETEETAPEELATVEEPKAQVLAANIEEDEGGDEEWFYEPIEEESLEEARGNQFAAIGSLALSHWTTYLLLPLLFLFLLLLFISRRKGEE